MLEDYSNQITRYVCRSYAKAEQIERIGKKVKSGIHSLKQLRKDQPGVVKFH